MAGIRKIVMPVRGDGKGDGVLAHAAALARRFNAHIVVTHCRARPDDMLPFGVPIPAVLRQQMLDHARQLADVEEAGLRAELHRLALSLGLAETESPDFSAPSLSFVEEAGRQVDVIKHHGRLADVVAVAQPDRDRNLGANTLKAALFNTGRPVLMCPDQAAPQLLGARLAIAWNGSLEASRAVALAGPIIDAAEEVTILTAGKTELHGATTQDLVSFLALRGINATVRGFEPRKSVGLSLLEETKIAGADLLIMGAYGMSHERETLFGGNTQTIVDQARIPVLMVH